MPAPLPDVIAGLLSPAAYPHAVDAVELLQTHISYVLLAGDFAYKIKKPLDLHFLDYSTLDRRRRMCEEEVRLNRRLCSDAYLGVVGIVRVDGRYVVDVRGEPVEYAVKMRRMPRERMLPEMLARGDVQAADVARVARVVAAFHRAADTNDYIAAFGRVGTLRTNWQENFDQTEAQVSRTIDAAERDGIRAYVDRFLRGNEALFDARAASGRVRDCHGDLRSDSIVIREDGSICVMDCIEFSDRIRFGDVASDLAFLAMDFDFRGRADLADELVAAYLGEAPDETLPLVLNFYRCYRAYVRGKVDGIESAEAEVPDGERAAAASRARSYFALAHRYASIGYPLTLLMMTGLSASGKSYLAAALAGRVGAAHLSSDVVRPAIAEGAAPRPGAAYGAGGYDAAARARVYDELHRRAAEHLALGRCVVLDATYISAANRAAARRVADAAGARFLAIEVVADEALVRARMAERGDASAPVSDARWEIYVEQRKGAEPPAEMAPDEILRLSSERTLRENVEAALDRLDSGAE